MKTSVGASQSTRRASSAELAMLGVIWLVIAAVIAAGMVGTPIVATLAACASYGSGIAVAALLVVLAVLVPFSLAVAGTARIREALYLALEAKPALPLRPVMAGAAVGASTGRLSLPDGRAMPEVAIGRFGAAVFRHIPGDAAVRRFGDHFEFQVDGQWIPFDEPSRRAGRDAAALQSVSGLAGSEFVAKVYAAVVTTAGDENERPGCAILRPDQILPFLAGLPLRGLGELHADDSLSALVA